MASNSETPLVPSSTKKFNGNKKNSKEYQQMVLSQVNEMFDSILDPDLILSVVQNCKWKLQPSIDSLITLSANVDISANQNNQNLSNRNTNSFNKRKQNDGPPSKIQNANKVQFRSSVEQSTTFLNLNDSELQRQQEEFKRFEQLKKNLSQKGFSSFRENMSAFNCPPEDKISSSKLQQFSQNWSNQQGTINTDGMTKGIKSRVNTAQGYSFGQLNTNRTGSKQQNDNPGLLEYNHFSKDLPNKLYSKGTIPKSSQVFSKSPVNAQNQQNFPQHFDQTGWNEQTFSTKPKKFNTSVKMPQNFYSNQYSSNVYSSSNFTQSDPNQEILQISERNFSIQEVAQFSGSTHKMETESLCGLKVQYRLPGLENSSDDDADVVIEEETIDYHVQIPPLMSPNVCQFLLSSTQNPPKTTYSETQIMNTSLSPRTRQRDKHDIVFDRIKTNIQQGNKILVLLRGLPGSGKSSLAKSIIYATIGGDPIPYIFSTDDYFVMLGHGVFQYDPSKLQEAHTFNKYNAWNALEEGRSPVIIDNTNMQYWDMQPYASMAVKYGYIVEILEPNTPWSQNINELAKKNVHGVPKMKIKQMSERYDRSVSGSKLLQIFSLKYTPTNMPPQARLIPPLDGKPKIQETTSENDTPKSKRNRRRKKDVIPNTENVDVLKDANALDYLLSTAIENPPSTQNLFEASNTENASNNDVSSTAVSDYDALRKLGECDIETDSVDKNVNESHNSIEKNFKENEMFGLMKIDGTNDSANSQSTSKIKHNLSDYDNKSTTLNSETVQSSKDILNAQQNLGAIGSERKGSLTTIQADNSIGDNVLEEDNNENVLSQCWDFTLLLNGTQIHSVNPLDSYVCTSHRNSASPDNITENIEKTVKDTVPESDQDASIDIRNNSKVKDAKQGNVSPGLEDIISGIYLTDKSSAPIADCNAMSSLDTKISDDPNQEKTLYYDIASSEVIKDNSSETHYSSLDISDTKNDDVIKGEMASKTKEMEIQMNVSVDTFTNADVPRRNMHDISNSEDSNTELCTAIETDKKDIDTEGTLKEENYTLEADPMPQERVTIGSIFNMIKKSLLGGQTNEKSIIEVQGNELHEQEINENSALIKETQLLEEEIISNETINLNEQTINDSVNQLSNTTVDDTFTERISSSHSNCSDETNTNSVMHDISFSVICDTLESNMQNLLTDDTLSKKLSNSEMGQDITFSEIVCPNSDTVSYDHNTELISDEDRCNTQATTENDEEDNFEANANCDSCINNENKDIESDLDLLCNSYSTLPLQNTGIAAPLSSVISELTMDNQSKVNDQEQNFNMDLNTDDKQATRDSSNISDATLSKMVDDTLSEDNSLPSISKMEHVNDPLLDINSEHELEKFEIVRIFDDSDFNANHTQTQVQCSEKYSSDDDCIAVHINSNVDNEGVSSINNNTSINTSELILEKNIEKNVCVGNDVTESLELDEHENDINKTTTLSSLAENENYVVDVTKDIDPILNEYITVDAKNEETGITNDTYSKCKVDINIDTLTDELLDMSDMDAISELQIQERSQEEKYAIAESKITNMNLKEEFGVVQEQKLDETDQGLNIDMDLHASDKELNVVNFKNNVKSLSENFTSIADTEDAPNVLQLIENEIDVNNLELASNENINAILEDSKIEVETTLDLLGIVECHSAEENILNKKESFCKIENEDVVTKTEVYSELNDPKKETYTLDKELINVHELEASSNEILEVKCLSDDDNLQNLERGTSKDSVLEENTGNTSEPTIYTESTNSTLHIDANLGIETNNTFATVNKCNEVMNNINQTTWKESPFPMDEVPVLTHEESKTFMTKINSATNTAYYDFNVSYVGGTSEPEYKILQTFNRSINEGLTLVQVQAPPLKLMLDKSSMTNETNILDAEESSGIEVESESVNHIMELMDMFPHVPREYLMEVYGKLCHFDFNWTVDVLLEGIPDDFTVKYSETEPSKLVLDESISSTSLKLNNTENVLGKATAVSKKKFDNLKQQSNSSDSNDSESSWRSQTASPRRKKDKYKISDTNLALKKEIEEKLKINDASYNPHILRVKRWKNGEPDLTPSEIIEAQTLKQNAIEFSYALDQAEDESEEFVTQNTDDGATLPKSLENVEDYIMEDDVDQEETMELHLGHDFIKVLATNFGDPEFQFPDGLFPVVQIRKSVAQELYALWIESMQQQLDAQQEQLDKMIAKDAEYAKSLEEKEAKAFTESTVPSLHEIMDMEMALAIYNNDMKEQLKRETPNDMASRLTRQMLHEMFPDFNPDTLNEILKAHDGNFKETVEVLEANTGQSYNKTNTLKKQKNLMDKVKQKSIESSNQKEPTACASPLIVVNPMLNRSNKTEPLMYESVFEEGQLWRKEAQRQFKLRIENFNKAAIAYRKGNSNIAAYYSHIANLHSKKIKLSNSTAASAFLAAQTYTLNEENTLDLHNLFVPEALQALDVFLEYQLDKLNKENKRSTTLYIITGRGARSNNGVSKIKPAISKKLATRNIRFMDANPGCLRVVLNKRNIVE